MLVGIALSNWRHAIMALIGSVAGTAVAHYHNDAAETISLGLYGYNAALAAMAIYLWRPSLLTPILAAVVSVPITELFPKVLGLPALTAPFVVAAWIILAVGALESRFVRPLPEQSPCI
jgi:urea transporter